jgi:hypothetical protein
MWLDLLMLVNHEDKKVNVGMELFECKRGQVITSLSKLSERWRVSRETTRHFLSLLEKDTMITTDSNTRFTQITICNYDSYNNPQHTEQTPSGHRVDTGLTPTDTTKEYKELEELKEEIIPPIIPPAGDGEVDPQEPEDPYPFDEFWKLYDKKVGDKDKLRRKWEGLSLKVKEKIFEHVPRYKAAQPDKQFRKDPSTYLNQKAWDDEIIERARPTAIQPPVEEPKKYRIL